LTFKVAILCVLRALVFQQIKRTSSLLKEKSPASKDVGLFAFDRVGIGQGLIESVVSRLAQVTAKF